MDYVSLKLFFKEVQTQWQLWVYATPLWGPGKRDKRKQEGGCFPSIHNVMEQQGPKHRAGSISQGRWAAPAVRGTAWGRSCAEAWKWMSTVLSPGLAQKWTVAPLRLLKTGDVGGSLQGGRETAVSDPTGRG